MTRQQKSSLRSVYSPSSILPENSWLPSSNNDAQTFLGKVLTLNHNQFFVESILGQGGFAFVFLVRSAHQQRFALKRMYVNNRRDLLVSLREIDLLKEFSSHANIVKFFDASIRCIKTAAFSNRQYDRVCPTTEDDDDSIYEILLLTEFCSNGPLINRLNEQHRFGISLNEQEILRIFADICRAVSACHFRRPQPILHRDVKLENIIIDSHQSYVLCDFGSAILLSPSPNVGEFEQCSSDQMTTSVIQQLEEDIQRYTTLAYRPPEMIDLYSRIPITLKADIWAMGCLLYKLMYNAMPFGESTLAIQSGTFFIPDNMSNTYSRDLKKFLRYILETDVKKRPDIWQISYITFKFLALECPIQNRCQSKVPDLSSVSIPLTNSEFREQRASATTKTKSTSTQMMNELTSIGTDINPRERPRGIMPGSVSLANFTSAAEKSQSSSSYADSAGQLKFYDNFCKQSTNLNSQPSLLLPPSAPVGQSTHRRSASQTISSTANSTEFSNGSPVEFSNTLIKDEENLLLMTPDSPHSRTKETKTARNSNHHRSLSGYDPKMTPEKIFHEFDPYQSNRPVSNATNKLPPSLDLAGTTRMNRTGPIPSHQKTFNNLNVNNTMTYSPNEIYPYPRPETSSNSSFCRTLHSTGPVQNLTYPPIPQYAQTSDRIQTTNQLTQLTQTNSSSNVNVLEEFF